MNVDSLAKVAFALIVFSTACQADSPASKVAEDIYGPLKMQDGIWDAHVTLYEADKPVATTSGIQVNSIFDNGHWMTSDLRINGVGKFPLYQGHGVWGYDSAAKTYVNTWVDSNDMPVRTDYGSWNAKESTMVWSSKLADGHGDFVNYRMTDEFKESTHTYTFYQLDIAKPVPHVLVKIVFKKMVVKN
jgi:hypothetical protein